VVSIVFLKIVSGQYRSGWRATTFRSSFRATSEQFRLEFQVELTRQHSRWIIEDPCGCEYRFGRFFQVGKTVRILAHHAESMNLSIWTATTGAARLKSLHKWRQANRWNENAKQKLCWWRIQLRWMNISPVDNQDQSRGYAPFSYLNRNLGKSGTCDGDSRWKWQIRAGSSVFRQDSGRVEAGTRAAAAAAPPPPPAPVTILPIKTNPFDGELKLNSSSRLPDDRWCLVCVSHLLFAWQKKRFWDFACCYHFDVLSVCVLIPQFGLLLGWSTLSVPSGVIGIFLGCFLRMNLWEMLLACFRAWKLSTVLRLFSDDRWDARLLLLLLLMLLSI